MAIEFDTQFERICNYSTDSVSSLYLYISIQKLQLEFLIITQEFIEQALFSKISTECRCNFSRDDFIDSSTDCEDSGKLIYTSTIEYSNEEGSETASVITDRLIHQAPFSLMVEGIIVRDVAVDSTSSLLD